MYNGSNLYYEVIKMRSEAAAKLRMKRRANKRALQGMKREKFIEFLIKLNRIAVEQVGEQHPRLKNRDPNAVIRKGLQIMKECQEAECPPLPCGADDAWMEDKENMYRYGRDLVEAGTYMFGLIAKQSQEPRNIHAFDEWYFGDRVQ